MRNKRQPPTAATYLLRLSGTLIHGVYRVYISGPNATIYRPASSASRRRASQSQAQTRIVPEHIYMNHDREMPDATHDCGVDLVESTWSRGLELSVCTNYPRIALLAAVYTQQRVHSTLFLRQSTASVLRGASNTCAPYSHSFILLRISLTLSSSFSRSWLGLG